MEVGAWDQRQRGIGRHFSMVKQFYIFILITFLLLRFSCIHTMYFTCSQLHPSQLLFSLVNSYPYLLSSLVSSPSLPSSLPWSVPIPTYSLPWSIPQPYLLSSLVNCPTLSSLINSTSLPPLFPGQVLIGANLLPTCRSFCFVCVPLGLT